MKRPRVGILANTYRRDAGLSAGGHINFVEIAKRIPDIEFTIFAPSEAEAEILRDLPSASFVAMPTATGNHWRLEQLLRALVWLPVRAKLRSMDALWATSHFIADVIPSIGSKPGRVAVTIHHYARLSSGKRNSIEVLLPMLSQLVSLGVSRPFVRAYIFVSPFMRKRFQWFLTGKRAFTSSNGVAQRPERRTLERFPDAVYVGRLDPNKRVEDAIEAWSRINPVARNARLHIIGDGSERYRSALRELAAKLGVAEQVIFHGRVDEETKWKILEESSIFIFPSAEEGWGIAVAEAMAAGLPCVTADLPVYVGLFDRGRISVPVGDVEMYARACDELLRDPERREQLARDARALAVTLSWERAASVVRDALHQTANG
ncbi:MAG TPA: glycosyltransferase family 4 protein [Candidatus Acidoferrales bacterium]|nr:glycosyltransferase family 4 protein [Candidatus Acidoferrales bacterium]